MIFMQDMRPKTNFFFLKHVIGGRHFNIYDTKILIKYVLASNVDFSNGMLLFSACSGNPFRPLLKTTDKMKN
jgi:hypothetical protein